MSSGLSAAMQDYLAETYRLAQYQDTPHVSTSALAEVMSVSAPAVTRMVQRLKEGGYLDHEPYQGITLTAKGEREALMTIRRHRIVERFLVDVMRFGWHEVHDAADALGETVSDVLVARMYTMAGQPRRCPHGEPIPTEDGVMPTVTDYPLPQAEVGGQYVLSRANSHDEDKLRYLDGLGLRTGVALRLIDRAPFNGPLHIEVNGQPHFIGYELARLLRVCTAEEFQRV